MHGVLRPIWRELRSSDQVSVSVFKARDDKSSVAFLSPTALQQMGATSHRRFVEEGDSLVRCGYTFLWDFRARVVLRYDGSWVQNALFP